MPGCLGRGPGERAELLRSRARLMAVLIGALGLISAAAIRLIAAFAGRRRIASPPSPGGHGAAVLPAQPAPNPHTAPSRPGVRGCVVQLLALAITVALGGLAIFVYNELSHWHRPVTLTASTHNLGILRHMTLSSAVGSSPTVRWLAESGYVKQLMVNGPEVGSAEIILPLPHSQCRAMATALDARCRGGGKLSISTPVAFGWSSPEQVASTGGRMVVAGGLDVASSVVRADALRLTLSTRTNDRPSLCFSSPLKPVRLVVNSGLHHFNYLFGGNEGMVTCTTALSVLVGSAGKGLPPALEFGGISALTLLAWAPDGTLQGFSGQLVLGHGGTTVLGSPTAVSLHARDAAPLAASLDIGPARQSLTVRSAAVTSVVTNSDQIVPSEWDRDAAFVVPLLGAFVSVLVFAPLVVSVQMFMDTLKRWQGRLHLACPIAEERQGGDHASWLPSYLRDSGGGSVLLRRPGTPARDASSAVPVQHRLGESCT